MGAKKCSQRQEEAVSGRSVGKRLVSGLPPSSSSSVGRPACQQLEIRSVPFPQTPALSPHFHGEAPQRWGLYSPPTPLSAQCILASATELLGGVLSDPGSQQRWSSSVLTSSRAGFPPSSPAAPSQPPCSLPLLGLLPALHTFPAPQLQTRLYLEGKTASLPLLFRVQPQLPA